METTSSIALSRQVVLRREMNVVANNIANMNTNGFKGEKMLFVDHLVRSKSDEHVLGEKLAFVRDIATVRDTSEGHLISTSNPLDLAISGEGYFAIETDIGERYTRNGRFQLDQAGQLVTKSGEPVLSDTGAPFFFGPTDREITINVDGTISTENGPLGKLRVVRFEDDLALNQESNLQFAADPDNPPIDAESYMVNQGMLESSNVQPIIELTRMIEVNRSYDSVKKFIDKEDERQRTMIRKLNEQA